MKYVIYLSFLLLPLWGNAQAPVISLTFHRGHITTPANAVLKDGQQLAPTEKLSIPPGAFISIFSSASGRSVYRNESTKVVIAAVSTIAGKPKDAKPNELISVVGHDFIPAVSAHIMAIRSAEIGSVIEFKTWLAALQLTENRPLVIIDAISIPLSNQYFVQRKDNFFYLSYPEKSDTINKKLSFSETADQKQSLTLIIDSNIFRLDGLMRYNTMSQKMTLTYLHSSSGEKADIGSLWVRRISQREATSVMRTFQKNAEKLTVKNNDPKLINDLLYEELTEDFGYIEPITFTNLLNSLH